MCKHCKGRGYFIIKEGDWETCQCQDTIFTTFCPDCISFNEECHPDEEEYNDFCEYYRKESE